MRRFFLALASSLIAVTLPLQAQEEAPATSAEKEQSRAVEDPWTGDAKKATDKVIPSPLSLDPKDIPDGRTTENAVPVNSISTEYAFVALQTCKDGSTPQVTEQSLLAAPGGPQDQLEAVCADGEEMTFFFDISAFFGNMEKSLGADDSASALVQEMVAAFKAEDFPGVREAALKLAEVEPYHPEAYAGLTLAASFLEDWEGALKYGRVAERLVPTWIAGQNIMEFAREQLELEQKGEESPENPKEENKE